MVIILKLVVVVFLVLFIINPLAEYQTKPHLYLLGRAILHLHLQWVESRMLNCTIFIHLQWKQRRLWKGGADVDIWHRAQDFVNGKMFAP